jgi:hypothetical protein
VKPLAEGEQSPRGPNFYYDYASDSAWFQQFCKPGMPCAIWLYWYHSGARENIKNWRCTVMNAADFGQAQLTLWAKSSSWASWTKTRRNVAARTWLAYYSSGDGTYAGRACDGDGISGTFVNVGFYWKTPAPAPPPPPPCTPYLVRAHSQTCRNLNGTVSSLRFCADGCGSTLAAAQQNAAYWFSTQSCIGSQGGCCTVTYDQNFNSCGY